MKRMVTFALSLLALLAFATGAAASMSLPAQAHLKTNAHLRRGPSADSESMMILMQGTELTVVEIAGGWLRVRYGSNDGYIFGNLIVPDPEVAPGLMTGGDRPVLRFGSKGDAVKDLQVRLIELGFLFGEPDGYFGDETLRAVREMQAACSLSADGVVGRQTYIRLDQMRQEIVEETAEG